MLKVGLTGGLASGKSFVARALADLGCHIIEADRLGHEVLLPAGEAYADVVANFGPGILGADGSIDRKLLARDVFDNPERLALLNSFVHPAVYRREDEILAGIAADNPRAIAVIVAAILIETGSYRRLDKLVLTICTREQQIERAMHREGAVLSDVLARLDRQMPLEEKRAFADFVIDTSGTKDHTLRQTRELFDCLQALSEVKSEL